MSKQTVLIIRIALFGVLGLLLLALVWDRFLAKPGSEAAFTKVKELIDQQHLNTKEKGMMKPADVQAAIGTPSKTDDQGYYMMETYSWRRGNLFSSYYINVVYTKRQDEWHLHNVFQNQVPAEDRLPQQVGTLTREVTPEDNSSDGDDSGEVEGGEIRTEGS